MILSPSKLQVMKCKQKLELNGWALLELQEDLIPSPMEWDWFFFSGPDLVDCGYMKKSEEDMVKARKQ